MARAGRSPTHVLILGSILLSGLSARPSAAQIGVEDFDLGGSASVVSRDCIRLTPDVPYVSGSAWLRRPIDLRRPFELSMSVVLGDKNEQGADGIVFVLHPQPKTGFRGEGLGFAGLAPSLGVEIDTYRNLHLDDPVSDHLAVMRDGASFHGPSSVAVVELGNVEDGRRHPFRVSWDPEAGRLRIRFDSQRVDVPGLELERAFGGRTRLHWGITAGTGRLSNAQDVCFDPFASV